ncbi:hypothetical protein OCA16_31920 [Bacillus cereus]|nr:hypothetical protein [Bacillus cereus]
MERRKACEDELKALEEEHERVPLLKTMGTGKSFLRLDNLQFFAKKKVEEEEVDDIDDDEDDEEEEEEKPKSKRKPKSGEERPSWVNELLEAIKPKEQANNGTQKVPVPPKPKVEEEDEVEVEEQEEQPKKKRGILDWLF